MSIRQRGPRSFEVRIGRFRGNTKTRPQARELEREFEDWRDQGLTEQPVAKDETLRAACQAFRIEKQQAGLTKGGLAYWRIDAWEHEIRDERGRLLADRRLSEIQAPWVRAYINKRAQAHPASAKHELQTLKAILRQAAVDEIPINQALLHVKNPRWETRVGRALTEQQLKFLAERFLPYMANLVRLDGTVGCRIGELLNLADAHVDLEEGTIILPSEMVKEGRTMRRAGQETKRIPLTDDEVKLLRRQKMLRAPNETGLYFPRKGGSRWPHGNFWAKIWAPAVRRASRDWRRERGEPDPFIWGEGLGEQLRPHDLRHTAATWMCDRGVSIETAALRLGHHDGGKLLKVVYDHRDGEARARRELELLAQGGN